MAVHPQVGWYLQGLTFPHATPHLLTHARPPLYNVLPSAHTYGKPLGRGIVDTGHMRRSRAEMSWLEVVPWAETTETQAKTLATLRDQRDQC